MKRLVFGALCALVAVGCVEEPADAPEELVEQDQALFYHPPTPDPDCEPVSTVRDDLQTPVRVALTRRRNILTAEGGSFAASNTGRISRISPDGSDRMTLLGGLPGAITTDGVPGGPAGLARLGSRRLYIATSRGDVTIGTDPGVSIPNPNGPSSPLFSALLQFDFSRSMDRVREGFTMTMADQNALKAGQRITLHNSFGERVRVKLVADLPDIEDVPGKGLTPSSPFGLVVLPFRGKAYISDSSLNSLEEIDLHTGAITRVVAFDSVPNPLPFGPPALDAVPTSVRRDGNKLLVSLETGFPFPTGVATIEAVSLSDFSVSTFIGGLTQAIDLAVIPRLFGPTDYYIVELSANLIAQPFPEPGSVLRFDGSTGPKVVLSDMVNGPSGVAYDRFRRRVYATEAFTSALIAVDEVCAESK